MTPADSKTIDDLREAYRGLGWLQRFFPRRLAAALTAEGLPSIEKTPRRSTPYTVVQANAILTVFTETNWLSKLLFRCLGVFQASSLLRDYAVYRGNLSFLEQSTIDRTSKLLDNVLSRLPPPGMPLTTETPAVRATTDRGNALPASIGEFLGTRDIAALGATSHRFHGVFKPDLDKVKIEKLLLHVVRGEQKKAETILKLRPDLLTQRGDVTDYSGRTFHNVSPWECMLWAGDTRYMANMMLDCIPAGIAGVRIRQSCLAQSKAIQAGGRDLVKMSRNPSTMPVDELKTFLMNLRVDNQDIFLCHPDPARRKECLYYYTNGIVTPVEYEPTDDNEKFMALFRRMGMNSAKKSNDAEHALITTATGKTLSRNGIRYEQPATYKSLVKIGGNINPGDMGFSDIARLLDTNDALLFWNNQFYYANKADRTVTPITPIERLFPKQIIAFDALKTSLAGMPNNTARLPTTLKEHQLINTLFREHPAFKPTHHCESHYDFGIIDALQTYIDRFNGLNWDQRNALWVNLVAKIQRLAPAHILQHYCDPERGFYPAPDFKADKFERGGRFFNWISGLWANLFSSALLDSDFGFKFGLLRLNVVAPRGVRGHRHFDSGTSGCYHDLSALRRLCEVRTDDARLLQDQLHQLLVPSPVGPTERGSPS